MPAEIHRHISISLGGKAHWLVKPNYVEKLDNQEFVKVHASDPSFVKLVIEGLPDIKPPRNASLSNSDGIKQLVKLRNTKQAAELQEVHPAPSCGLFGDVPEEAPKKRARRSTAQIKELRQDPGVLAIEVPGVDDRPSMSIPVVRPVRPQDDLRVPLDSEVLEHIVLFIRNAGITEDMLMSKRAYKGAGEDTPKGVWKTPIGFTVKLPKAEHDDLQAKRFRRVKTVDDAVAVLVGMEETEAQGEEAAPVEECLIQA